VRDLLHSIGEGKVPRQFLLFLLVEARLRQGKALGSDEGKASGSGLRYEHRREF
jgi:hypothetical protein